MYMTCFIRCALRTRASIPVRRRKALAPRCMGGRIPQQCLRGMASDRGTVNHISNPLMLTELDIATGNFRLIEHTQQ